MYPSSSSTSSQSLAGTSTNQHLLTRYGSAPSSLLNSTVDSVLGIGSRLPPTTTASTNTHHFSLIHHDSSNCDMSSTNNNINHSSNGNLQRLSGFSDFAGIASANGNNLTSSGALGSSSTCSTSASDSPSLIRHSSSPAGFLNHLASEFGFHNRQGADQSYNSPSGGHKTSRLSSQMSFTKQESLAQISEVDESCASVLDGINSKRASRSYSASSAGFSLSPWDEGSNNTIVFSNPSKRAKNIDDEFLHELNAMDSQFGMPHSAVDVGSMDNLLQIPQDSVPCKIRAKRGCATHPRSIAERERRTRISGKLKKLQDLVPNMDKQTSYSDMLDLAVQHIKGLQTQIQKLQQEQEKCTCCSSR